jgi:hypothetical protein
MSTCITWHRRKKKAVMTKQEERKRKWDNTRETREIAGQSHHLMFGVMMKTKTTQCPLKMMRRRIIAVVTIVMGRIMR